MAQTKAAAAKSAVAKRRAAAAGNRMKFLQWACGEVGAELRVPGFEVGDDLDIPAALDRREKKPATASSS